MLLVVLLMLLPTAAALIYESYDRRRLAEEFAIAGTALIARGIEGAQDRLIESAGSVLDLLSQMPQVRSLDRETCRPILENLRRSYPRYATLGVFTPAGDLVCNGIADPRPLNVADRSWFRRAIESRSLSIGDYQIGRLSGKPSIGIAKPMIGADGGIIGVVYAALDLVWLSNQVAGSPLPPSGVFVMLDGDGTVIARYPQPEAWIGRTATGTALSRLLIGRASAATAELPGLDGLPRLYHAFPLGAALPAAKVWGAVGVPLADIRREINLDLARHLLLLVGFGCVLMVVGYLSTERLISLPLQRLVDFTHRVAAGDLAARSGVDHRAGELGQLAAGLDGMADSLLRQRDRLAERNALLAESQATAQIGSWEWVIDDPWLRCSPELARIFGLAPGADDRLRIEDMLARVHPDDRQGCFDASKRVIAGEPRTEYEFRLLDAGGEVRHCWAVIRRSEPEPESGRPTVRGTTQDITGRKRAELLREREARFIRVVLDSISDGIIACDADGRLMTFNASIERLHGVRFAPVPAEGWSAFFGIYGPDGSTPVAKEILPLYRALLGEVIVNEELQVRPPGGEPRTVLVNGQPLRESDGRSMGAVVTVRDVTDLRRVEASLHQAQKMEAVGQLTGGIAHDFNNLLSIVIGNLDSLLVQLRDPAERELANEALAGALRGAELTKQMLAFARRQALNPVALDIVQVLRDAATMLQRTLGGAITVEARLEEELWLCHADPSQLETAILNLALNARDAMPDGGRLTIAAGNTRLDEPYAAANPGVVPGDYVRISVTDTGTGIPPDILNRVIEPFFTTKEPGKGTGLGLSMVEGFVRQSGGHLKIYSEVGHGTTISLYLPRALRSHEMPTGDEPVAPAGTGSETVLVVDDDSDVRRTAAMQLAGLGYRVIEAPDAPTALGLLRGGAAVDLVFSDVVMPGGMTGLDLAEQVRHIDPRIKVLLVTGFAEAALRQANAGPGAVPILSKPYRRQELATRVRQVLDAAPQGRA